MRDANRATGALRADMKCGAAGGPRCAYRAESNGTVAAGGAGAGAAGGAGAGAAGGAGAGAAGRGAGAVGATCVARGAGLRRAGGRRAGRCNGPGSTDTSRIGERPPSAGRGRTSVADPASRSPRSTRGASAPDRASAARSTTRPIPAARVTSRAHEVRTRPCARGSSRRPRTTSSRRRGSRS
jgi:hypothetical protein